MNTTEEQYKEFLIQESESVYYIRNTSGQIIAKAETEKAAREWIDTNQ